MARTFVSQPNQIFSTEDYNDALTVGSTLQTNSTNLESDLNAIRTQIRQVLWAGVSGSWYDAVTAPSGSNSARGLNTINVDLTDLEQKRFLFRRQQSAPLSITTGSNTVILSVTGATAPASPAAINVTFQTGTVVASLDTGLGVHSMNQISGSTVLTPKNLVIIRDHYSDEPVFYENTEVFGLLQIESGSINGTNFDDISQRAQISFIYEDPALSNHALGPVPAVAIGGKVINYAYPSRTALDSTPEDAYFSNTIFLDPVVSSGSALLTDITLDRAIDNQVGTVTQDQNIAIRIAAGFSWTFLSGTKELWKLVSSDTGDSLTVAVDRVGFSSSFPTTFEQGISVATGSTRIDLGVIAGTVQTLSGNNLILSGGAQLRFGDFFGTGSSIPFSTSSLDWSTFYTNFGTGASILGTFNLISSSLSSSLRRTRFNAGVTAATLADVNVTFPTNLDAALGSYVGRDFKKDLEIYLNGILLLPGSGSTDPNDVYPGNSDATGDLKFPYKLRSGSQIVMVRY